MNRHVSLITLGQSPRPDLLDALGLSGEDRVTLIGALDSLGGKQVNELKWVPGDEDLPLFTWYEGQEVMLARRRISRRLQDVVTTLPVSTTLVAILCTESFPDIRTDVPLLRIDKLLTQTVTALSVGHPLRLGVLVPVPGQVVPGEARWNLFANAKACFLPPRSSESRILQACEVLKGRCDGFPDLVVLDCVGYGRKEVDIVSKSLGCTVIWPVEWVAMVLNRHLRGE
ncbi:MAG: AroM family protein [Alicyclobacillus sp.]|nr:AroM family protein [Alicyclobacillus sp.]